MKKIKALQYNPVYDKLTLYILVGLLATSALLYGYLVNQTVLNVVARKAAEERIAEISSEVSSLERRYLDRKDDITREYAYSLGFHEERNATYVYRNGPARALTLLDNE